MELILVEPEVIDERALYIICEELRELARTARNDSGAVDRLEWKAARIIEAFIRDAKVEHER